MTVFGSSWYFIVIYFSSALLNGNVFSCLLGRWHSHFCSAQIKATDNGRPQKWSAARLHIEWIRRPPTALPLLFHQPFYNFTVMENDKVSEIVGVVSLQRSSAAVWFDITSERGWVGKSGSWISSNLIYPKTSYMWLLPLPEVFSDHLTSFVCLLIHFSW